MEKNIFGKRVMYTQKYLWEKSDVYARPKYLHTRVNPVELEHIPTGLYTRVHWSMLGASARSTVKAAYGYFKTSFPSF